MCCNFFFNKLMLKYLDKMGLAEQKLNNKTNLTKIKKYLLKE